MKRIGEKSACAYCLTLGHLLETNTPTTVDAP